MQEIALYVNGKILKNFKKGNQTFKGKPVKPQEYWYSSSSVNFPPNRDCIKLSTPMKGRTGTNKTKKQTNPRLFI